MTQPWGTSHRPCQADLRAGCEASLAKPIEVDVVLQNLPFSQRKRTTLCTYATSPEGSNRRSLGHRSPRPLNFWSSQELQRSHRPMQQSAAAECCTITLIDPVTRWQDAVEGVRFQNPDAAVRTLPRKPSSRPSCLIMLGEQVRMCIVSCVFTTTPPHPTAPHSAAGRMNQFSLRKCRRNMR